ncbi:MAG: amidohydrolase family protein, partial [Selenomonadaceae bacterium]|nr:amidohydrolase family protein [Selenomonadaceae bacterium]
ELKIFDRVGSLEVGKVADITIFDDDFNIKKTFVDGVKHVTQSQR